MAIEEDSAGKSPQGRPRLRTTLKKMQNYGVEQAMKRDRAENRDQWHCVYRYGLNWPNPKGKDENRLA